MEKEEKKRGKEGKRWKEENKRAFPFFAIDIPQTYHSIYIIYNTVYRALFQEYPLSQLKYIYNVCTRSLDPSYTVYLSACMSNI